MLILREQPVYVIEDGTSTINRPTEDEAFNNLSKRVQVRWSKLEKQIMRFEHILIFQFHNNPAQSEQLIASFFNLTNNNCKDILDTITGKLELIAFNEY